MKQGSYQLEQDLIANTELEQKLALLKKEMEKITREQDQVQAQAEFERGTTKDY